MMTRGALYAGLLTLAVMTAGCGENFAAPPATPTGPTTLSPLFLPPIPAVDGLWGGPVTLESLAGGTGPARDAGFIEGCILNAYGSVLGSTSEYTLALTETETGLQGTFTSGGTQPGALGTGLSCRYTGRLGDSTLAMDAGNCDQQELIIACPLDETFVGVRRLELVGSSITATYSRPAGEPRAPTPAATVLTGRAAHTYHIIARFEGEGDDEDEELAVGTLVANHNFTLTRR